MMQRTSLFLVVILLSMALLAQAQNYGGGIHFRAGLSFVNTDDFTTENDELDFDEVNGNLGLNTYYGIEEVNPTVFSIGLGGYGVTKNILYDFEFLAGSNLQIDQASDHIRQGEDGEHIFNGLYMGELFASAGYVPYRKEGFVTYPLVGFGITHSGMLLQAKGKTDGRERRTNYPPYINDELQSRDNVYLWTNNFAMKFAGRAEYHFGANTPERAKGFTLALELGYRLGMASVWRANGEALDGKFGGEDAAWADNNVSLDAEEYYEAPSWSPSGLYFRLLIGGGRVGTK